MADTVYQLENNKHQGVSFAVDGTDIVATVTYQSVGAAAVNHTHEMSQVSGLQAALDGKADVSENFDSRYVRYDAAQGLTQPQIDQAFSNLTLGTAATRNAPSGGDAAPSEVVLGNDSRLGGAPPMLALGNITGTTGINLSSSRQVTGFGTMTGNVTLNPSNVPGSGTVIVTLFLIQDGTGGRTLTLPGSTTRLNGWDGSLNGTAGAVNVVTLTTVNGGSAWQAAIADSRPTPLESLYFNPVQDGPVYFPFDKAMTLNLSGHVQRGTGSVTYHRSSNNGSSWGSALTGSQAFAVNDVLRVTVAGFSGWYALAIPRTA